MSSQNPPARLTAAEALELGRLREPEGQRALRNGELLRQQIDREYAANGGQRGERERASLNAWLARSNQHRQ